MTFDLGTVSTHENPFMSFWHMIELCRNRNSRNSRIASHTRTPGPDTGQRHDILLSPRCYWEFGQQSKSQVEQIGHANITQTDAFNYMSYHFLCKRGIRPPRTEQFLVIYKFNPCPATSISCSLTRSQD